MGSRQLLASAFQMIREWLALLRLGRVRFRSEADYHRLQTYQGSLVIDYLEKQGIRLRDTRVLDLGCGRGGYSDALSDAGARVVSIDLKPPQQGLPALALADAVRLPFASTSFPIVFCASLIEHVPNPARLLAEIYRVLTADGSAYLSFPPFYTPVGGHQFKPFHLLGERWALRLSGHEGEAYATCFGDWGLYPVSIRRARGLIAGAGLKIWHESTRFVPINLARLPWIGEFLTWHVQFIVRKGSAGGTPDHRFGGATQDGGGNTRRKRWIELKGNRRCKKVEKDMPEEIGGEG
jgi:SAM-dependent methyltransferase